MLHNTAIENSANRANRANAKNVRRRSIPVVQGKNNS